MESWSGECTEVLDPGSSRYTTFNTRQTKSLLGHTTEPPPTPLLLELSFLPIGEQQGGGWNSMEVHSVISLLMILPFVF